ncbi:propionate--CoA ligase [Alkalisalibacterium limincola]|uniref:Propionate--CoA ligase n=1 Tax=Alkalisalibacterium limincola TaxID=2699169 RepID=A0A5C8KFY6_9GAMM|nr:propionate--CoA ligase [Alkalisalibacterium limincola]TXK59172.1 propionate--CoA ligase [Alkalisalibacterium limincola]
MRYEDVYRRSIEQPEAFWAEAAGAIDWETPPERILDYSNPPFRRWFVGGRTNLCHNAVDRHLAQRGDQPALIAVSTETNEQRSYSYRDVHREVNAFAATLAGLGVEEGDRVVIYMPNIAQAAFAMLACARLGAVHSVVFGGFAAPNLALRIDDARPKVLVCADAGMRAGKVIRYKPLVDRALEACAHPPGAVLVVNRGLDDALELQAGRDHDFDRLRQQHEGVEVPVAWVEASHPSYLLYTSGTTGKPKGVQRETGGYAVALALSMRAVYDIGPGQVMFTTSDVGWVVGHSYIVYGPLIAGATSIIYEGLPTSPDPGIWWRLCAEHGVRTLFSSPTAIRVLKKQDPDHIHRHDLSKLQYVFLAGEPLDEPTARWAGETIGKRIIDNYWQTETGWPVLSLLPGVDLKPSKLGSPGLPNLGYRLKLINEVSGEECAAGEKGVLAIVPPLPPGCLSTVWGDDQRFLSSYFSHFKELLYSSLDWAIRDEDGYYFILGRTDDVINVAGHRLGTREIEESASGCALVAEAAVIGAADETKGQVPVVFALLRQSAGDTDGRQQAAESIRARIVDQLGAVAGPARIYLVEALPKTRSGKLLRRSLQALVEQRDPGDLSTLDDPGALDAVKRALEQGSDLKPRKG